MEGPLLHEHSPAGYFKELLDSALARQHVTAGDLTAYYLVNLLCQFVRADASDDFGRGASRWRSGWPARSTPAAAPSAPSCGAWETPHSSCAAFSQTASPGARSTSITTCRWESTRTAP